MPLERGLMNIELACGNCDDVVVFAPRRSGRLGRLGRLLGTCRRCSSVYRLAAGQVTPIEIMPFIPPGSEAWRVAELDDQPSGGLAQEA